MRKVAELFATLLDERFESGILTTEDSVRYTYFHAILSCGYCRHKHVILEHPHPALERQIIDTVIIAREDLPSLAIEFKYDRAIPSKGNLNMTNRAGAVFSDLFKLAHIPDDIAKMKYFFYVTDSHMANYFQNEENGYRSFFELKAEMPFSISTQWIGTRPKSFRDKLQCSPVPCTVLGFFSRNLTGNYWLRSYELRVQHASAKDAG